MWNNTFSRRSREKQNFDLAIAVSYHSVNIYVFSYEAICRLIFMIKDVFVLQSSFVFTIFWLSLNSYVSEWLLFIVKWALFQLYHGGNKVHFDDDDVCLALDQYA